MQDPNDPKLLDALRRIFTTRDELRQIVEHQQQLFNSIQELLSTQGVMHEHVRKLTDSHNRVQGDTEPLVRLKPDLERVLRDFDSIHRQTQSEVRHAVQAIGSIQQEIRKISTLEDQIAAMRRDVEMLKAEERDDGRKNHDQDQRLHKLEQRK